MKCPTCEGFKGYQPLYGPFEPCEACAGTGEAKQTDLIAAGNLVLQNLPATIVCAPVWHALPAPKRFRDEMPPNSMDHVLIWHTGSWTRFPRGGQSWASGGAPTNLDTYWLPQPPPP